MLLFVLLSDQPGFQEEDDIKHIHKLTARSHSQSHSIRMDDSGPKLSQPNFDESEESEKSKPTDAGGKGFLQPSAPGPSEATSDDETVCSLLEYVPQTKNK